MADRPKNSAAVTAGWIDAVLRGNGIVSEAKVTGVEARNLGEGVGIMAEVARLSLVYDRPNGGPASVIAKFPATDPVNLGVARALHLYPREVAFYARLAGHSPIRTPRLLHADLDSADHGFVLLLEDLREATVGDQLTGLDRAQAEAAITALARLHGTWWGKVDAGEMTALFDFADPQYGMAVQAGYQGFLASALTGFADCYSDYTRRTAEAMAPVAARVIARMASGVRTFVHGDYRADNLLFGPDLGEDGVAAIDWQVSGRCGPLYDVAYLLCNSLPADRRPEAEQALLRRYHDTLLRMGVTGFSFEDCREAYRFAVLCGLFIAVFATGGMGTGNRRGAEMVRAAVRRIDRAVSDLEVASLLPG
jgi:hypothetical protein